MAIRTSILEENFGTRIRKNNEISFRNLIQIAMTTRIFQTLMCQFLAFPENALLCFYKTRLTWLVSVVIVTGS